MTLEVLSRISQRVLLRPTLAPALQWRGLFDAYSELVNDTISGGASSAASQSWDAAGRRTGLGIAGGGFGFGYQADGLLTSISGGSYTYSTSGLLLSRTYSPRVTTISQRDGDGRPLSVNTKVNGTTVLSETATLPGRWTDGDTFARPV